jgi:hypothetical protein
LGLNPEIQTLKEDIARDRVAIIAGTGVSIRRLRESDD